jgi:hypothetical protein
MMRLGQKRTHLRIKQCLKNLRLSLYVAFLSSKLIK